LYQIGWFSTGRDKAARDLLQAVQNSIEQGEIETEIAFVFCSHEPGESEESDLFIRLVEDYNIPLVCFSYPKFKKKESTLIPNDVDTLSLWELGLRILPYRAFKNRMVTPQKNQTQALPQWRLDYDREVMRRLKRFGDPDLCVLAGYMLIVGKEMCQRYNMINLHPAAPGGPAGSWQEVVWQLIENRAQKTGVMMHLVTPELDQGPPVSYCTFPIRGTSFDKYWAELEGQPPAEIKQSQGENNQLFRLIRQHGLAREFPLIIATIKAFSQGRVRISVGQVVDAVGNPIGGYDLTGEIDEILKGTL